MINALMFCLTVALVTDIVTVEAKTEPKAEKFKLSRAERDVFKRTNAERVKYGRLPLKIDRELVEAARSHTAWMSRYRSLQHSGNPGGENIARGQRTSEQVVRTWMNSSGHRANILNSRYRSIGIATETTQSGTVYWCQQFHY